MSHISIFRLRRGLTLIEAALVLGVVAIVFGGLAEAMSSAAENGKSKAVADRLNEVTMAAQQYVNAQRGVLLAASNGNPIYIPVGRTCVGCQTPVGPGTLGSLQSAGFLPSSYVDMNAYGQSHALVLKSVPSANGTPVMEGLLFTTGGNQIPDRQIGRVARFMGVQGGFRPILTSNFPNAANGQVIGVAGGWSADPTAWSAGGQTALAGHVAAVLTTDDGTLTSDFLNRKNTGDPEANTMRTDLNMGGNLVNNAAGIYNDSTNPSSVLKIGPNIQVPGYVKAGGDVTGKRFVDGADPNWYVQPSQVSVLNQVSTQQLAAGCSSSAQIPAGQVLTTCGTNQLGGDTNVAGKLSADKFNVDTVIYGTSRGLSGGEGIKLGDLLSPMVTQAIYRVSESDSLVPVPVCRRGGAPKISLSVTQDSYQYQTAIDSNTMQTGSMLGGSDYADAGARQYFAGQTVTYYPLVTSVNGGQQKVAWSMTARAYGASFWQVVASGTARVPGYEARALATTYCYYAAAANSQ